MSFKILLPQPILESGRQYLLDKGYELVDGSGFEEEDIIRDIKGCDGMIVRTAKITRRILEAADSLKVIARHGAGFDGVDLEAAREKGIVVLYAPRANSQSVAELAIFYMLHCSRNFKLVQKLYRDDYRFAKFNVEKHELNGKTLGSDRCGKYRRPGCKEGGSWLRHEGSGFRSVCKGSSGLH